MRSHIRAALGPLRQQLTELEARLDASQDLGEKLSQVRARAEKLANVWSGTWAGTKAVLYRFDGPWKEETSSSIGQRIAASGGPDLLSIMQAASEIERSAKELKSEIERELGVIHDLEGFEGESALLAEIKNDSWGSSATSYHAEYFPPVMTGSLGSLSQGFVVPPHIQVASYARSTDDSLGGLRTFASKTRTLLRRLEIKVGGKDALAAQSDLDKILLVCDRLAHVARQLRSRHDKRETLVIKDEYDVQDLLQSLLKLYYDDIRPEEWTPSYAGAASRMDHLLPTAHTAVEAKIARTNHRDKEIGEELLVDIAKYRQHATVRTLVCLVYDPDGILRNARGLETDLARESTEKLRVVVLVRP